MRTPRTGDRMSRMLDPRIIDPHQELVSYATVGDEELAQIVRLLVAMSRWRDAERALSARSRERMRLGETDMEALRFLVAAESEGGLVTPGALAEHLGISTASTTKLLDRLAAAGHVVRAPHPTDGRAAVVHITRSTHEAVRDTVGRAHARRFDAAKALTPAEREVVIGFLEQLSADAEAAAEDA